MNSSQPGTQRQRPSVTGNPARPLPEPDGPVDPTVVASPIEEVSRPGRFTLMATGWMPPPHLVTQALGLCFTADGLVVMVTWDGRQWSFPGGTVEDGESVEQALVREVAEEACARVARCQYLASQHVADPLNPDGRPSYYQTRWWARIELDPGSPKTMIGRRLVAILTRNPGVSSAPSLGSSAAEKARPRPGRAVPWA
jgi:ADP-ribose pyrophosphatase YjhB (NUDIX family)